MKIRLIRTYHAQCTCHNTSQSQLSLTHHFRKLSQQIQLVRTWYILISGILNSGTNPSYPPPPLMPPTVRSCLSTKCFFLHSQYLCFEHNAIDAVLQFRQSQKRRDLGVLLYFIISKISPSEPPARCRRKGP